MWNLLFFFEETLLAWLAAVSLDFWENRDRVPGLRMDDCGHNHLPNNPTESPPSGGKHSNIPVYIRYNTPGIGTVAHMSLL